MTDVYAWWRAALDAPEQIGKQLKMTTTPEPGFYRRRYVKNGPWVPVWIYPPDEPWLARVTQDGVAKEVDAHKEWESCRSRPITQAEYERVAEKGLEWADADPTVATQRRENAKPGDNQPADEAEILKDQIDSAKRGAERYGKLERWTKRGKTDVPVVTSFITDEKMFAQAQEMRSRLLELFRDGNEKFRKEKDPINAQAARVDERWRFRNEAEQTALIIREAMAEYETQQLAKQRAAEDAARRAEQEAALPSFVPEEQPPAPPPPAPVARATTVKGSSGRAATVGVKWDVVAITDQDRLYQYLKEHPDLKAFLLQLAQRGVDAGRDVPGIEKKERATIK